MGEAVGFAAIALMCAAVFIGIGIFSIKKKTPMHFWSGTTVKSEEISDVRAYNKENGVMWITYGATYVLAAILALLFGSKMGAILVTLSCTLGLIILIVVYGHIYKKYKNNTTI